MSTAGSMHMMIAREPAEFGRMNPATKLKIETLADSFGGDIELVGIDVILGSALYNGSILAGWKHDRFAVSSIDLFVKEEIRSQPARRVGIDSTVRITNRQCGKSRRSIEILNAQNDFDSREQDGNRVSKAEILRPLSDMKSNLCFPFSHVAAEDLDYSIFKFQSR